MALKKVDVADCFRKFADALDDGAFRDRLRVTDPKAEKLTMIFKSLCWYSENLGGVRLTAIAKGQTLDLLNGKLN